MLSGIKKVEFQHFINNNIVEKTSPLLIVQHPMGVLLYDFPVYYTGKLLEREIMIISNQFQTASFIKPQLLILDSIDKKVDRTVELFETDSLNGKLYEFSSFNISNSTIELTQLLKPKTEHEESRSIMGETAPLFTGEDLVSNETVSLDIYGNKFIYLDFWADWCSPCIKEIPNLKLAYEQLNLSKIDFLGIATGDSTKLKKIINEKSIDWKQIQISDSSRMKFNIKYFPTSYLINPNGEIVAKNLRGSSLIDTLNFFVNSWKWQQPTSNKH